MITIQWTSSRAFLIIVLVSIALNKITVKFIPQTYLRTTSTEIVGVVKYLKFNVL